MTRETDVLQLTNTLSSDHLQHALDLLATSKRHHDPNKWRPSDDEEQLWPDKTSHLYALSSMMHLSQLWRVTSIASHMQFYESINSRTSSRRRIEHSSLKSLFRNGMEISHSKKRCSFYSISSTQPILGI